MSARFVKIDLKIRQRGQVKKEIGLINKTTTLLLHRTFFLHFFFLASLHDHDIKMHDFHFMVDIRQKNEFSLSFSTWIWFLGIQLQE